VTGEAPLVAIVGRPNVGKSTLFNRIVGGQPALVDDRAGVTRDRRYGRSDYFGAEFRVVDTGGLDPEAESEAIGAGIHRQACAAIDEAAAVVLVVDGRAGLNPLDREVAELLRTRGKPVIVAVNKVDGPKQDALLADFYELGLGAAVAVSAAHGRGVDELLEGVVELLPPAPAVVAPTEPDDAPLRIAFVGKPNAGKSSLVNRLVGAERSLVHDQPGTTTDPVDTPFEFGGMPYLLVDTAGMRKRARIEDRTEKVSVSMALGQIRRADVVALVIDAELGPSEQDARIAREAFDAGRAIVLVLNKIDLVDRGAVKALEQELADELHFLDFAPRVMTSATRGEGLGELMKQIDAAAVEHRRRVPTAELNRFFAEVCETHPPPTQSGRSVRVHYLTQGGVAPPTFLLWVNRPKDLAASYQRYLVNQLRKRYGFRGTPVRVVAKAKVKVRLASKPQRRGRGRR
jgi:GTP-binding protein